MSINDRIKKLEEDMKLLKIQVTQNRASNQAKTFDSLNDTPANKTGSGEEYVIVNTGATALEYKAGPYDYDCKIWLGTNQNNIATSPAIVKILFDTMEIDIDNAMAKLVNNKITTVVAGLYLLELRVNWNETVANVRYHTTFRINGSYRGTICYPSPLINQIRGCQPLPFKIGAGEDIEGYVYHEAGAATPDILAGQYDTYLRATLLREA